MLSACRPTASDSRPGVEPPGSSIETGYQTPAAAGLERVLPRVLDRTNFQRIAPVAASSA